MTFSFGRILNINLSCYTKLSLSTILIVRRMYIYLTALFFILVDHVTTIFHYFCRLRKDPYIWTILSKKEIIL